MRVCVFAPLPQDGRTPLYAASYEGHGEMVDALLAKGADFGAAANVKPCTHAHTRIQPGAGTWLESWLCGCWLCVFLARLGVWWSSDGVQSFAL